MNAKHTTGETRPGASGRGPLSPVELRARLQAAQDRYRQMRVEVPATMTEVKGIFVGGCVERGVGSSFRAKAHAHTSGEYFGWLCFRGLKNLGRVETVANNDGVETVRVVEPTPDLWHEYAHILVPEHGHDETYRRTLRDLEAKGGRAARLAYLAMERRKKRISLLRQRAPSAERG